ncbi:MAG: NUDIX hydrolase [Wenzhouxiangella sp.]|jgi:ADP-ribose pyrophosphatase|nr:NUDIX hydrolase [Wenzhouxiangella sp.]
MTEKTPTQTLYSGRFLSLNERSGWEFVERQHAVAVLIAWTPDRELLLVEQYRIPIQQRTIELPAGLVGDHEGQAEESLLAAAARELVEETGWQAGRLRPIMDCPTSAGLSSETISFVWADDLKSVGPGGGDDSEDIIVHRIPAAAVDGWLLDRYRAGLAIDPKIYTALYWSATHGEPPDSHCSANSEK